MRTLYFCYNGSIKKVTLLNEHYLSEGATKEVYLCKGSDGKQFCCAKDMYHETEKDAYLEYLAGLYEALQNTIKQQEVFNEILNDTLLEYNRIQTILRNL